MRFTAENSGREDWRLWISDWEFGIPLVHHRFVSQQVGRFRHLPQLYILWVGILNIGFRIFSPFFPGVYPGKCKRPA